MQRMKKIVFSLLALLLLINLAPSAFAVREYTVRVYSGDRGTIADNGHEYHAKYGGNVSLNLLSGSTSAVTVKTEDADGNPVEYQVIGLREAGKGRDVTTSSGYFGMAASGAVNITNVTKDVDYVVAYSVPGAITEYEVQYLDYNTGEDLKNLVARAEGETLEDITFFYGVTGATISVAGRYIEGYTPRFAETRRTLSADSTQNVFPVYYVPNPTTTTTTTTTTDTGGGGGGGGGGAVANPAVNPANPANPANPNANNPEGNVPNNTNPVVPGNVIINDNGEEILDMDVPLAAPDMFGVGSSKVPNAPKVIESNQRGRIPNWALIAGMVVLVGLIAMLYWYLLFYRKKKKYASYNEDYEVLGFGDD